MDDPSTPNRRLILTRPSVKEENPDTRYEASQDRPSSGRLSIFYNDQYGCYMSEQPDSQRQYVGVKTEVETEEKGQTFCHGEGIAGRDTRIHMMYQETRKLSLLKVNQKVNQKVTARKIAPVSYWLS